MYRYTLFRFDPVSVQMLDQLKGDNLFKIHLRLAALIQNVALVIENKCVKFDENRFNIMEAMAMSVFFKVLKGR